ncbi:MAG: iron-sulfur cluster insertion protein ErpA [bacterium]
MVMITETAALKIKEILDEEKPDQRNLRIYVEGGGCAGFQYGFAFDDLKDDDEVYPQETFGFSLVVDPMSLNYLIGSKIDYVEGLHGAGFKIENPNSSGKCGCGSSFSA